MDKAATEHAGEVSGVAPQPVTFGGVASFAASSWRRLFIAQFITGLIAVAAVLVLLFNAWLPNIDRAINALPDNGYIAQGVLAWPQKDAQQLTDSRWLTIIVAPTGTHKFGQSADFQVELHPQALRIYSVFGYWELPYAPQTVIALNQPDTVPWWGARRPFFVAGAIVGTLVGLWCLWMLLAVIYSPVVRLLSFWSDRDLSWVQSIKLCAAALLMPGVLYSVAIASYGLGLVPLMVVLTVAALHVVMGWVYVICSPFRIPPRNPAKTGKKNPFDAAPSAEGKKPAKGGNPFKRS